MGREEGRRGLEPCPENDKAKGKPFDLGLIVGMEAENEDLGSELFPNLPGKGSLWLLAFFYLAAGQFPEATVPFARSAPREHDSGSPSARRGSLEKGGDDGDHDA
jgi:hypothetical protein